MPAAAFDTRVYRPYLPSSAARRATRQLKRLGARVIAHPEGFRVVDTLGPLENGEEERARQWGMTLAASVGGSRQHAGKR